MSKRKYVKAIGATCMAMALTLGATGCDAFITTDEQANMRQIVASVNISSKLKEDEKYAAYATKVEDLIKGGSLETDIPKRDLVAFYMSTGYQYVESYGYEKTFNMLLDALIDRKVLTQYSVAYYLAQSEDYTKTMETYINDELALVDDVEKGLHDKYKQVLTLKYFLTEGGEDMEAYDKAVYQLHKSINDSLDNAEKNYIRDAEEHEHGTPRTMPTGAGTEKEDFYIGVGDNGSRYQAYTGRNELVDCYGYEALDGSTKTTRIKAYNTFLKNLQSNNLIIEGENTIDFTKMDYYYVELSNQMETAIINKYTEALEEEAKGDLTDAYVSGRYTETLEAEKEKFKKDEAQFESAINSLSDSALPLYAPAANYGLVYNILIPFSSAQNDNYTAETAKDRTDQQLAAYRANLLTDVKAKDLRTSWFSEYDHDNYAYEGAAGSYYGSASNYLFFEDNMTNTDRYEELSHYLGKYAFNGTVNKDGDKYILKSNELTIDSFIEEMEGYMNFATGLTVAGLNETGFKKDAKNGYWEGYVTKASDYSYNEQKKEFTDYSEFMYYAGKVNFTEAFSAKDYFVKGTQAYNALAAFNELMFAYSTDTGCLNTYMGYVVSPYKTSFVSEFEYAAQFAVRELGIGGYVVCPSTYGWHVIYVSFVYEADADVYGGYKADEKDKDGTFSKMYFDMIKSTYIEDYAEKVQEGVLEGLNDSSMVVRYEKRYKDLTKLG